MSLQTSALQLEAGRKEGGGGEGRGLWPRDAQSLGVGRGQEADCEKVKDYISAGIDSRYFSQLKQLHCWETINPRGREVSILFFFIYVSLDW